MLIKNNSQHFGLIAISLHWLIALMTLGLFWLGLWMTDLGYYDDWYQQAPVLHEGIGVFLFLLLLVRILWRWVSPPPESLASHKRWEKFSSHIAHTVLNLLLLIIAISGYLVITAKGQAIHVFNLFSIPAITSGFSNQEDLAGEIHLLAAWAVIILAGIHALAAFKHHFIDKDSTLRRMLGSTN